MPKDPPLRTMRALVDGGLKALSRQCDALASHPGRPSSAPEQWLRAWRWPGLYTSRRERLLRAQRDDQRLVRWLVGLHRDEAVWDPTVCSQNRERLRAGEVAQACFDHVLAQARQRAWRSDDHGTVEGTRMAAWAGQKSFQRQAAAAPSPPPAEPGHPRLDCRGERRPQATPASTTAPAARLDNKATGPEAQWADRGPGLREHRQGVGVETRVTQATGTAEREAARAMAEAMPGPQRVTWGAEKHAAPRDGVRERRVTPPVAPQTAGRASPMEGRTPRHPGSAVRQRQRQGVEDICGWRKTVGLRRKVRHRGVARVGWMCPCAAAVDTMVRMRPLAAAACAPRQARVQRERDALPPWRTREVHRRERRQKASR